MITSGVNCVIGKAVEYSNDSQAELVENLSKLLGNKEIKINSIDVSNVINITVKVEDKFTVNLGTNEYLEQKIAHLSGMIDSIGERVGDINLSMWTPENSQGSFVEKQS